jgi:hypothetical protein
LDEVQQGQSSLSRLFHRIVGTKLIQDGTAKEGKSVCCRDGKVRPASKYEHEESTDNVTGQKTDYQTTHFQWTSLSWKFGPLFHRWYHDRRRQQ